MAWTQKALAPDLTNSGPDLPLVLADASAPLASG